MEEQAPVKFSLALGSSKASAAKQPEPAHVRHALFHTEDRSDEKPKAVAISGFDRFGKAIEVNKRSKGPLVIPIPPNRKRQRSGLPVQADEQPQIVNEEKEAEQDGAIVFGLNVRKKAECLHTQPMENKPEVDARANITLDDMALQSLLGRDADSGLVIPAVSEDVAFHKAYKLAPDVPTMSDYDRIPPEEFGAAMLRGMGWKDGEAIGKSQGQRTTKIKPNERRPALLGVGAKPIAATGIELGAWGKKEPKKNEQAYNPVIMRNKKTGEVVTEEELNERMEQQKKRDLELEEVEPLSSKRDLEYRPSGDSSRRKGDYDGSRFRSRHGADKREKDRSRHRQRDRDREKDRDRDRDRDRHRDRRHRSRSPHNHRHRSRSKERSERKYDENRSGSLRKERR